MRNTTSEEFNKWIKNGNIEGITFNDEIHLDFQKIEWKPHNLNAISFNNCVFKRGITIINFESEKVGLEFNNCSLNDKTRLLLRNCKLEWLILDCNECRIIDLIKVEISPLGIADLNLKKKVKLLRLSNLASNRLEIKNHESIESLIINCPNLEKIYIDAIANIKSTKLNNFKNIECRGSFGSVELHTGNFNQATFDAPTEENGPDYSTIDYFSMNSKELSGTLMFNEVIVQNLMLFSLIGNNGGWLMSNTILHYTHLKNVVHRQIIWNNVKFEKYLRIESSDLSGLRYSNVKWLPKTKFNCLELQADMLFFKRRERQELIQDNGENLKNHREVYRQLKAAALANQNPIDSLEFYRLEMRLYWKEIRILKNTTWSNRFLIFLNRWVSDFGQNWLMPLGWMLIIHWLLFMSLFSWHFSLDFSRFEYGLGEYFTLINPVHKTPSYINTGFGLFTDFWMRIFAGYFVYHLIRASRKYGKI